MTATFYSAMMVGYPRHKLCFISVRKQPTMVYCYRGLHGLELVNSRSWLGQLYGEVRAFKMDNVLTIL